MFIIIYIITTFIIIPLFIKSLYFSSYFIKKEISVIKLENILNAKNFKPLRLFRDYIDLFFLLTLSLFLAIGSLIFNVYMLETIKNLKHTEIILIFILFSFCINFGLIFFYSIKWFNDIKKFELLNENNYIKIVNLLEKEKESDCQYKKIQINSNNLLIIGMSSSIKSAEKYFSKWNSSKSSYRKGKYFILYIRWCNFSIERITAIKNVNIYIDNKPASIEELEDQMIQNFAYKINL